MNESENQEQRTTGRRWRTEPVIGAVALAVLLLGCVFVIKPFLTALTWAVILTYSLFPLQRRFTKWFRGSRTLAAVFVSLTVALILVGPVVLIGLSLAQDGKDLANATRKWFLSVSNEPPKWVAKVPVVGDELTGYWEKFVPDRNRWLEQFDKQVKETPPRAKIVVEEDGEMRVLESPSAPRRDDALPEPGGISAGADAVVAPEISPPDILETAKPDESPHIVVWLGKLVAWAKTGLIIAGKIVLGGVTEVVLSAFLAFFLLRDAPALGDRLHMAVGRLAGDRGRHLIKVAGDTVRGVIHGIIGTALAQAVVAGLGFWIAGVPGAVLLAVLTFLVAVVPFGPPLIWIPATLWLFAQDRGGWAIFMFVWGLLGISSVDNVIRPLIISQGSKMPFVLIFCGVIGGALAFGLVGVFLGPTLLAVGFRLIEEWSSERNSVSSDPERVDRITEV